MLDDPRATSLDEFEQAHERTPPGNIDATWATSPAPKQQHVESLASNVERLDDVGEVAAYSISKDGFEARTASGDDFTGDTKGIRLARAVDVSDDEQRAARERVRGNTPARFSVRV